MYYLYAGGKLFGKYEYFFDAWLAAKELPIWCIIKCNQDIWIVQPWNGN
jgi:hypothetical protein